MATVTAVLHPLVVIGCSAEAVVGTGRQVEGTAGINIWAGRVGPLAPLALTATQLVDDSWHFAGWPEPLPFTPSALVLVVDALTFPVEPFLRWLHERHPDIPVIGGASPGRGAGGTRLIVGEPPLSAGATGVLLGGGVDVETVVSQGARPYGEALTVTKAEGNLVYEVAGTPAMECLVQQIGDHLDAMDVSRLGTNGVLIGRLIHEGVDQPGPGDFLVRGVLGVDRESGAIAVDDRVDIGSTIRFHVRDGVRPTRTEGAPRRPECRRGPPLPLQRPGHRALRRAAPRRPRPAGSGRRRPGGRVRRRRGDRPRGRTELPARPPSSPSSARR